MIDALIAYPSTVVKGFFVEMSYFLVMNGTRDKFECQFRDNVSTKQTARLGLYINVSQIFIYIYTHS